MTGTLSIFVLLLCSNPQQNIFVGEDIRKQLPKETSDFDGVNGNWKVCVPKHTQYIVLCTRLSIYEYMVIHAYIMYI